MDVRTARLLARPDNGILTADEQRAFDAALREVLQRSTDRLGRTVGRKQRRGPADVDPELRRSYLRTQGRLAAQAAMARQAFPQLTDDWDVDAGEVDAATGTTTGAATGDRDETPPRVEALAAGEDAGLDDEVSIGTFEAEVTQTSDMMDVLEQIAGIQRQQLEHQRSQLLAETRGVFFALAVSVAVIVAGIAPLVEASADDRRLILIWTAVVCTLAGCVYAAVRAIQSRGD
jgi:hypothetical protein